MQVHLVVALETHASTASVWLVAAVCALDRSVDQGLYAQAVQYVVR